MKICFIGSCFSLTHQDGIITFNNFLISQLVKRHSVDILIPSINHRFQDIILRQKVKESGCQAKALNNNTISELNIYDAIIISGHYYIDYPQILSSTNKNILIWSHGVFCSPLSLWDGRGLNNPNVTYVCCNEECAEQAEILGYNNNLVLTNPIPLDRISVESPEDYGLVISTVVQRKKYSKICAVIDNFINFPVYAYGSIIDREVLRDIEQSDSIEYCGTLRHKELMEKLKKAKVLIHMSTIEGFPLVLREANGLGVPVIVPNIPLYKQNLVNDSNIFIDENTQSVNIKTTLKDRQELSDRTVKLYGAQQYMDKVQTLLEKF